MRRFSLAAPLVVLAFLAGDRPARGQSYGVDIHNTINPASGGLAGVSLARPQDVPSAVFGNPATLARFEGSQFTIGGAWSEPSFSVTHDGAVTGAAFSGKSSSQGCLLPTVGVIQDLSAINVPGSVGVGITALSGISEQLTSQPGSLGTHSEYLVLGLNLGAGVDLTERLALGASLTLGDGYTGGGFVHNSVVTHDYGLSGSFGAGYELTPSTTVGAYYQTRMPLRYDNLLFLMPPGVFVDLEVEQPNNVGFGIANNSLMCGNLLLACDVIFKNWDNCDYWRDLYDDQWIFAVGSQLTLGRWKFRLGYSYSDSPIDSDPGATINGIPVGQTVVEYYQATQAGVISEHRLTGGIGYDDFLPGVSFDLFAGGLFPTSEQFGEHTSAALDIWYIGGGVTWRFGQRECCEVIN